MGASHQTIPVNEVPFDATHPAVGGAAVIPDDSTLVSFRALWVGSPGDLKVTTLDGSGVAFSNASGWMPVMVIKVWATGTTASNITGIV